MSVSPFELHSERLSTTDEKGRRLFLYPADGRGRYRNLRSYTQAALILFFLILPWIEIAGRQALLFDIEQRRFEIFGLSLRAHNAPLLLLVFAGAAFGLFFATAIYGRIWCGWACPQTVFIDGLFRRIERWIEGPALERRRLASAPLSLKKIYKRTLKWMLYLVATLVLTHSFLAYFVGHDRLSQMIFRSPTENWGSFIFMLATTGFILFDFAWFREQFCTIVCPYGRFQSVLMDKGSLIVSYDVSRGEPRVTPQSRVIAKNHNSKLGDCVNCYRCVQVCPTGIDIRRGVQMECIACTACIDACDEVMTKLSKPTGLIRYDSLAKKELKETKIGAGKRWNLRAIVYLVLCLGSLASLGAGLYLIQPVSVEVLRAQDAPYTVQSLEDGASYVLNHFKFELSNQSGSHHSLSFSLVEPASGDDFQLIIAHQPLVIVDGQVLRTDIFVRFLQAKLVSGQVKVKILIQDRNEDTKQTVEILKEVVLVGPLS
jgi:cytochrome c oxidase accessory protein FixG